MYHSVKKFQEVSEDDSEGSNRPSKRGFEANVSVSALILAQVEYLATGIA